MANVTVADQVKAPADVVWALIGPYGSISSWMPGIASADVEGSGVGAVRVLTTDDGGKIAERLLDMCHSVDGDGRVGRVESDDFIAARGQ